MIMTIVKATLIPLIFFLLPGCAAVPFGIGLIPGAPTYFSSLIGNGPAMYETAMDERTTQQQMADAIIAGHAQAELYKSKGVDATQVTAYSYFGKLYLVGEYENQEQLKLIYESVDKVKNKRMVISRLYLKEDDSDADFIEEQTLYAELKTQLTADFEVTSSPIDVEIVQGDIILLGVISDKEERDRIMAHAMSCTGVNRVVSYLFHQENAGPEPRILTATLPPQQMAPTKPAPPLRKKRAAKPVAKPKEVETSMATTSPPQPEVINGRVLGL